MFFFILVAWTIFTGEISFDDEVEGSPDEQTVFFIFLFQNHRLVKVINECQKSYNNIDAKRNVRYKRKTLYNSMLGRCKSENSLYDKLNSVSCCSKSNLNIIPSYLQLLCGVCTEQGGFFTKM